MSLFVAGTDTGVGKTLVSAVVLRRYARELRLAYWKPLATGAQLERDRATIEQLVPGADTVAESYLFAEPLSPHLAARREGQAIEVARIESRWRDLRSSIGTAFVVEGAGGLLVPLDEDGTLLVDLIAGLRLPVLLVARSTVGTINHTLLSLEALRRRELAVAGAVLSGPSDVENRRAIERFGGVAVLAELPLLDEVDTDTVGEAASRFDPAGVLRPWLSRSS